LADPLIDLGYYSDENTIDYAEELPQECSEEDQAEKNDLTALWREIFHAVDAADANLLHALLQHRNMFNYEIYMYLQIGCYEENEVHIKSILWYASVRERSE
jgi:hypothetical protein